MNLRNSFEIKAFDSKADTIDQLISCVCPFNLELVNFFGSLVKTKHVLVQAVFDYFKKTPLLYVSAVQECNDFYELDIFISELSTTELNQDVESVISDCLSVIFKSTSGIGKQLFIDSNSVIDRIKHLFITAGMRYITNFSDLTLSVGAYVPNVSTNINLHFLPFSDFSLEQLNDLFFRTSTNTLDCPEGLKFRNITNVFNSLVYHPLLDAKGSQVAKFGEIMAGIVFVVKHEDQAEIAYFGIAEEYRAKGFGRALIDETLRILAIEKVNKLTVVVDEGNFPAIKLYLRAGMKITKKRILFLAEG